jgi:hypothetical protein
MFASNKLLAFSLFVSFTIFLSHSKARADEVYLATVTTDTNNKVYTISVDVNDETRELSQILLRNKTPGENADLETLSFKNFVKEGIVVNNNTKIVFAKVTPDHFDLVRGGGLVLDLVANILTNKRKIFHLELAQDQNGWKFFKDNKPVGRMIGHANKIAVVGTVGVRDISFLK